MKMYRNLLIFLAIIILVCSVAEALLDEQTRQPINEICKQTTDTEFCNGIFDKNLIPYCPKKEDLMTEASCPSKKDLMNVTVTEAERFSANTYFFISTLLRNSGDERPYLQMCAEAYAIVNMAFTNAVSFFNQGLYGTIFDLEEKVSNGLGICKTDFTVPGYEINPMIKKNRETMVLMAMEKIVGHLASS